MKEKRKGKERILGLKYWKLETKEREEGVRWWTGMRRCKKNTYTGEYLVDFGLCI